LSVLLPGLLTNGMTLETLRTSDSRQLCYAQWGDPAGFPVFSLHGTPGCRLNRYPDDDALAAIGARLITYDRPGYGRSDRQPGRRVVDCVADVAAIADVLDVERFAVTGGSGGGPHALAVAARLPDRVTIARCVVGVAPADAAGLDWTAGMDAENVKEFGWALAGEATLYKELDRTAAELVANVTADASKVLGDEWQLSESDRAVMRNPIVMQIMREAIPECVVNGPWGWVDDDLAMTKAWGFDLDEISVPVEVHYGSQDVLVPATHGAWLAANVPSAKVVVNDDQGHMNTPEHTLEMLRTLVYDSTQTQ
jgi:pimeloyl-ACP methyl ester carboxylesterase